MDIRDEYKSLIVKIENKEELIETQSFIDSIKYVNDDLSDYISVYPNYLIYRMDVNVFNFLTNSSEEDNETFQLEILHRNVINNQFYKAYPIIFKVNDNNFNRIKNIIIFGKDFTRPNYKPKKFLRESTNYKYNGWVVFKSNNIEDTNYIINNINKLNDTTFNMSNLSFPHYIYYNFTLNKITNLSHHDDEAAIRFMKGINDEYNHEINSGKYIIPHVFNKSDSSNLKSIRIVGLDKPSYKPKNFIREDTDYDVSHLDSIRKFGSPKKIQKFESFINIKKILD